MHGRRTDSPPNDSRKKAPIEKEIPFQWVFLYLRLASLTENCAVFFQIQQDYILYRRWAGRSAVSEFLVYERVLTCGSAIRSRQPADLFHVLICEGKIKNVKIGTLMFQG
jgi:hypothetical protein